MISIPANPNSVEPTNPICVAQKRFSKPDPKSRTNATPRTATTGPDDDHSSR